MRGPELPLASPGGPVPSSSRSRCYDIAAITLGAASRHRHAHPLSVYISLAGFCPIVARSEILVVLFNTAFACPTPLCPVRTRAGSAVVLRLMSVDAGLLWRAESSWGAELGPSMPIPWVPALAGDTSDTHGATSEGLPLQPRLTAPSFTSPDRRNGLPASRTGLEPGSDLTGAIGEATSRSQPGPLGSHLGVPLSSRVSHSPQR